MFVLRPPCWISCRGEIQIDKNDVLDSGLLPDSFLNLTAWGKGVAYVNGFNLGWYWPSIGPQNHYYVPGPRLKTGGNEVILIEFEAAPKRKQGLLLLFALPRGLTLFLYSWTPFWSIP